MCLIATMNGDHMSPNEWTLSIHVAKAHLHSKLKAVVWLGFNACIE